MNDLRAITITWDPMVTSGVIDVALGPDVSVAEAHHILGIAYDDTDLCPRASVTRAGIEIAVAPDEDDE